VFMVFETLRTHRHPVLCFSQKLDLDASPSDAKTLIGWLSKVMIRMKRIHFGEKHNSDAQKHSHIPPPSPAPTAHMAPGAAKFRDMTDLWSRPQRCPRRPHRRLRRSGPGGRTSSMTLAG